MDTMMTGKRGTSWQFSNCCVGYSLLKSRKHWRPYRILLFVFIIIIYYYY